MGRGYSIAVPVTFQTAKFEGPLDLLLQLVEQEELAITEVSLATVAEQFVQYVRENQGKIVPEELADFLVVAAKLVYLKSKLLLPSLVADELDEGPDLATQLRLYQQFVAASRQIDKMWVSDRVSFARERRPIRSLETTFSPPPEMTTGMLLELMRIVVDRLAPLKELPQTAMKRVITIQDKISELADRLRKAVKFHWSTFWGESKDRSEKVVSFLALLELVKQRVVKVNQEELFEDIEVSAHELDRLADLQPEFV